MLVDLTEARQWILGIYKTGKQTLKAALSQKEKKRKKGAWTQLFPFSTSHQKYINLYLNTPILAVLSLWQHVSTFMLTKHTLFTCKCAGCMYPMYVVVVFLNTNCAWNSFTEQLYFDSSAKYLNCLFGHLPLQCSIYCQLIWCAWHVPPNNNPLDKAAYIAIDLAMESCFSPRDESTLNIPTWLGLLSIS